MAFESVYRSEKQAQASASHAAPDLFTRVHQELPIKLASAQGGGLEPGPGNPTGPIEPPPTPTPTQTIVNNNSPRGGDAHATSASTSRSSAEAAAHSRSQSSSTSRVGDVSSTSTGSNISTKSVFTAPPSLGGGECTMGLSGGALGFALGGQLPNMDCIREKTGAQKEGQTLDFSVRAGVGAVDALDHALANVDKANEYHKQGDNGVAKAHIEGANAQRAISGQMATESVTAAEKVLGPTAAGNSPGTWSADMFNDSTPPAPQPTAEIKVIMPRHGNVHHGEQHKVKTAADCVDKK